MKSKNIKDNVLLFLYAILLCLLWYFILLLTGQMLAAFFSLLCTFLALVNLFILAFDTFLFMKDKLATTTLHQYYIIIKPLQSLLKHWYLTSKRIRSI